MKCRPSNTGGIFYEVKIVIVFFFSFSWNGGTTNHFVAWSLTQFHFWFLGNGWSHRFLAGFAVTHQSLFGLNGRIKRGGQSLRFVVTFPVDLDICYPNFRLMMVTSFTRLCVPVSAGCRASWSCCMTFFSKRSSSDANKAVPLPARAMPSTR